MRNRSKNLTDALQILLLIKAIVSLWGCLAFRRVVFTSEPKSRPVPQFDAKAQEEEKAGGGSCCREEARR